jgi:hypothetical protein
MGSHTHEDKMGYQIDTLGAALALIADDRFALTLSVAELHTVIRDYADPDIDRNRATWVDDATAFRNLLNAGVPTGGSSFWYTVADGRVILASTDAANPNRPEVVETRDEVGRHHCAWCGQSMTLGVDVFNPARRSLAGHQVHPNCFRTMSAWERAQSQEVEKSDTAQSAA